ncbi:MAG: hypothetical protein F2694_09960 [Actinobacteria bacterium]|uniref:Unannotated protein n=1 Tax=freshwater metagenome TaxID=449393 RepID=A0A6J6UCQ9_9ZZZZ|nr:hypothetical protein [Actinomycetota bacterium]
MLFAKGFTRAAISLCVVAGALSACSQSGTGSADTPSTAEDRPSSTVAVAASPTEFEGEDFYEVPKPLPDGTHGQLIRYERLDRSDNSDPDAAARSYRIMYLSESIAGEPIAVTGVASVPTAQAPTGGRPLATLAHGTTGIADECAPSQELTRLDMGLAISALGAEFVIAGTDYEGLGTPGRHPYLVGESEGRSTLDAIVAAGQLPDAQPGKRVAILGYSQGGHGALWASQLAAEWTPELQVVGTFAGAPASETDVVFTAAPSLAGFAFMLVAGYAAAYPQADPALFLTDLGLSRLDEVDVGCAAEVIVGFSGTNPADLVRPEGPTTEPWKSLAAENIAGSEKTNDAPTLIIHSQKDETVPIFFSELLLSRMCANGQVVERRVLPEGGHGAAALPSYQQALTWVQERFAADPPDAVNSC